jgi:hypothetical protein
MQNPEVTYLISFIYDILYSPENKSSLQVRQPPFTIFNFQENTCIKHVSFGINYNRGAHIKDARYLWWLSFASLHLIFESPQYRTYVMSPSWCLEF